MKTTKALFRILVVSLAVAARLQAQSSLTNGLVAYYPFNGNANDASGGGNNLANYGATLCRDRFGVSNQAYFFNGSAYLGSSVSPLSQTDNWTIAAWMIPASLSQATGFAVCVGYDNGSAGDGYAIGISGGEGTGGNAGQPGNRLWAFFPGLDFISDGFSFTSTNGWCHVVMMRNSGTLMIYVNGEFTTNYAPTLASGQAILEPTSFEIGSGGSSARFFNGAVDEVRVYNRPLTASEVQQLYSNETGACNPHAASATAALSGGFVVGAAVNDGGCGYTNVPLVQIVGGGGNGATAIAMVTNGIVVGITITDAGIGYSSLPMILISPPACVPYSATAQVEITNGFVFSATVTDGGCGYTNAPTIQILGGGGTGATATAIVTNGEVIGITITDAGSGYTNTPAIYISSPVGAAISLLLAVVPMFTDLSVGTSYQLQVSTDLVTWQNQGVAFMATNTSMIFTNFFNVTSPNQLYFRLQGAP
jgi:hypothetical protein